ncbi:TetR/AcrR family transcriptional regulator [Arthrobacter sp. CAN_C5]|uniref:TetR/AcrR family transcriptional regulator n=1 Tax=Arthrobacter sp. CAN_C5 TaxID=2760706 RepID=UPI001AEA3FAF|nr:TetR/AcrR family transcriptional regulator [Arthrobacter sp. CAN_C5]MBP2217020.1 TetR/AcrR family transcriptional repressor of nem operon [Arthrobacter sp. CAN_C5]
MERTSDGRERLLAAASALLSQRSFSSIGIAEICATADVQKGSFYYHFQSKQALALAVIEEHWVWQGTEWAKIFDAKAPLLERLRDLFGLTADIQVASLAGAGSVMGCLFGNLALEMSRQDDPIRERLQGIFDEQIDMVERAVQEAMDDAQVLSGNARETAKSIVAQLEGLVLFAKLFNDPTQLDQLWENSMSLLRLGEPTRATRA